MSAKMYYGGNHVAIFISGPELEKLLRDGSLHVPFFIGGNIVPNYDTLVRPEGITLAAVQRQHADWKRAQGEEG